MSYTTQITGSLEQLQATWLQSRELIPQDVREQIAAAIFNDDELTRASLHKRLTILQRHFFAGNVPPVMMSAIFPWFELQQRNLELWHLEQGTLHLAGPSLKQSVLETLDSVKAIEVKQTRQFLISTNEIRKPELVQDPLSVIDAEEEAAG